MHTATWNEDSIVGFIGTALAGKAREYDVENAPQGIDSLTEAALQQCICDGLNSQSIIATREARYPAARVIEPLNQGQRCDLLLFRGGKEYPLQTSLDAGKIGYWLEIKRVAQFLESGPNWQYERALLELLPEDVFKLANDPAIFHAGLLVILFAGNAPTANRDLTIWKSHALNRGCPVGMPRTCDFTIANRIGNEHAVVALFPLRRL